MKHLRLANIGLTEEEISQELSQKPLTKETIAALIVRNNQQIAERVNGVIDDLADTMKKALKERP